MYRYALLTNALLILLTATSFAYNLNSSLAVIGLLCGLALCLPSLLAFVRPGLISGKTLLAINTMAIVLLACIIYLVLYLVLTRGSGDLALNQLLTLVCALGLCANSQLLYFGHSSSERSSTVNDLLHQVYGGPSIALLLALALIISGTLLTLLAVLDNSNVFVNVMQTKLLQRGVIPFLTIGIFWWGVLLLVGNYVLVKSESKQLLYAHNDGNSMMYRAFTQLCDETKPRGREARLEQLQLFMDGIWNKVNYFFTLPRFINWAIPILGFLGTVLGISLASESIAAIIKSNDSGFGGALGEAFAPLGIAFDTTLISLTLSLVFMLIQSLLQRWQERQLHILEQQLRLSI